MLASSDPADPADPDLAAAFDAARKAVLAMPYVARPDLDPPTCTYLAAVVRDDEVVLASLGDCRSYWVDEHGASQITTDDSWASEVVASGELTMQEAMARPQGHAITRWISIDADPQWRPRLTRFDTPGPGRLIVCSDGLWNYALDPAVLASELAAAGPEADPVVAAQHLVRFANEAGGHDNITVVVIDLPLRPPAAPTATDETATDGVR